MFKQHKILPFKDLVTYRKAVFMWKVANGYAPSVLSKFFTSHGQDPKKYVLPHPPNDHAKNYFVYSSILAWNCVPDALKHVTIFSTFTRNLKGHLQGEPIEDNIHLNNNIRNNTNNVTRSNNNNSNNSNNSSGIRVLRWVRPSGRPNVNALNPPFATRWDNPLRNF